MFITSFTHQGKQGVRRIKENFLPNIKISDPIFEAMCITHCFRWDYNDSNYGAKATKIISEHFRQPILLHKFKVDPAVYEFWELKWLVKL